MLKSSFGQDMQYSQFYANPLYLNPALAGKNTCPKVNLNYRNQWPAIGKSFTSYSASYDQFFENFGGIGFLTKTDYSGEGMLNNLSASGIYAHKFNINRTFTISTALEAAYIQSSIDWHKLTFGDMIDPQQGFVNSTNEAFFGRTTRNFDCALGTVGYSNRFYAGFAIHHILEPKLGFINSDDFISKKYTLHGGYLFYIPQYNKLLKHEEQSISVNILLQQQRNSRIINTGFYYNKIPLVVGIWYRRNKFFSDALILLGGIQKKNIKFGYSYDITLSKKAKIPSGSHEISLTLHFDCSKKKKIKKKIIEIKCPTF